MRITIPRWAQLVLIPLAVIVVLYFSRAISHALFIFLMALLVTLLLNPVALALHRVRFPRWVSVPLVYLAFGGVIAVLIIFLGPPLVRQFQNLFDRAPEWIAEINRLLLRLETYLAANGIDVQLQLHADQIISWLQGKGWQSVGTILNLGVNVAGSLITFILVIVVSFYMLIDGRRILRFLIRMVPGDEAASRTYLNGLQGAFSRFIRGQALLGITVGLASGIGIWILGWDVVGVWPEGSQYAVLFGFWAGITEVIPYIGPWIGAVPPVIIAAFHSPVAALWVIVIYFVIQQLESHILAPNIVGSSVGVHPLVVMFALLAGAQIGGIWGIFASLPLVALLRYTLTYYDLRLSRASWVGDDGVVLLPVEPRPPNKPENGKTE